MSVTLPATGWTKTPLRGYTVPNEDGSTDPADWGAIAYQMGVDIENGEFLTLDSKKASDLASTYPVGTTIHGTSAGNTNGWPTTTAATVVTFKRLTGNFAYQLYFTGTTTPTVQVRSATATGWSPWFAVAGPASPVAARSGTYTFASVTAPRSVTIAFPAGRFTVSPQISVATHNAGVYANVNSVTPSGFTLVLSASDGGNVIPSGDYLVDWTAMQTDGSGS